MASGAPSNESISILAIAFNARSRARPGGCDGSSGDDDALADDMDVNSNAGRGTGPSRMSVGLLFLLEPDSYANGSSLSSGTC